MPALKPGGKAIDIGTGSGYLAACFAEIMGEGCTVYALDHIKEITEFALNNIKKQNAHLVLPKPDGRIIPVTSEGR
jgi:protein-L-isoaspartate(D-aspartate) O-methyltransferase